MADKTHRILAQLSDKDRAIYTSVRHAAERGQECPSNPVLAVIADYSSIASPVASLKRLQQLGLIEVERFAHSRVVTFPDGIATKATIASKPHWRDTGKRKRVARDFMARVADLVADGVPVIECHRRLKTSRHEVTNAWHQIKNELGGQAI